MSHEDIAHQLQQLVDAEAAVEGATCLLRVEAPAHGVWHLVAGGLTRDGEPAAPTTPFRIASITKPFTAVVIAQLAAEGRLRFDDLMTAHLPAGFADLVPRLHVLDGVSYGETITLRQLLTHASGLMDYAMSEGFYGELFKDPSHAWTPREMLEGACVWGAPHFPPGQGYGYAYSDTGYVLLGVIIEHLEGRPLHEVYRGRIIEPLGLSATYLEGFETHRGPEMAHPYEGEWDAALIHGSADWAGGGLVSDVDDLAVFVQSLFAGRLVPPAQLDEMTYYAFRTLDPALHSPGYLGYGFGLEARESDGFLLRGHRGHWGAWMHLDPVSGLTITGTINQSNRRPDPVVQGVTAIMRGLLDAGAQ